MAQRTNNSASQFVFDSSQYGDGLWVVQALPWSFGACKGSWVWKNPNKKGHYLKHYREGDPDSIARGIAKDDIGLLTYSAMKALQSGQWDRQGIVGESLPGDYSRWFRGWFAAAENWMDVACFKVKFHQPRYRNLYFLRAPRRLWNVEKTIGRVQTVGWVVYWWSWEMKFLKKRIQSVYTI